MDSDSLEVHPLDPPTIVDLPQPTRSRSPIKSQRAEKKNWVGLLTEYRAKHPRDGDFKFNDEEHDGRYICTVKIVENETPIGDKSYVFTRKKDAKQYAAQCAIEWLIENDFMSADTIPPPLITRHPPAPGEEDRPAQPDQSASVDESSKGSTGETSPQAVVRLCLKMGYNIPQYRLDPVSEEYPNHYSGYAVFKDPRLENEVGHVELVYGRERARTQCADLVLVYLQDLYEKKQLQLRQREQLKKRKDTGPTVDTRMPRARREES